MPRVYVASPLGFSPATRGYHDDVLLPAIRSTGWEVLDPWADLDGSVAASFAEAGWLSAEARVRALAQVNRSLGRENEAMIRRADALLAVLDGTDVDSGTAAEIGFAAALGTPTIGLRLDLRLTGDNEGTTVNLQVEHFIRSRRGTIARTLPDALEALAQLAG